MISPVEAVTQLYADHYSGLKAWLRRKTGCPHHAADLAHDTYMRVIECCSAEMIETPQVSAAVNRS